MIYRFVKIYPELSNIIQKLLLNINCRTSLSFRFQLFCQILDFFVTCIVLKYEYTYPPFILYSVSFRNSHSSNPSLPCIVYKVPSSVTFKLYLIDFIKPFQTAHCFSELAEVFQLVCSGVRGCMGSAAKVFYYGSLFSLNYY